MYIVNTYSYERYICNIFVLDFGSFDRQSTTQANIKRLYVQHIHNDDVIRYEVLTSSSSFNIVLFPIFNLSPFMYTYINIYFFGFHRSTSAPSGSVNCFRDTVVRQFTFICQNCLTREVSIS